jgi:hypothetical protein
VEGRSGPIESQPPRRRARHLARDGEFLARLSAEVWRGLEEVAGLGRMRASEHQDAREWAREVRSRRNGVERMLAERDDEMPWRLRESFSRLRAFLPDPDRDEDFEDVDGWQA